MGLAVNLCASLVPVYHLLSIFFTCAFSATFSSCFCIRLASSIPFYFSMVISLILFLYCYSRIAFIYDVVSSRR